MAAPAGHHRSEARLPGALAVLVAVLLYAVLPQRFIVGPRYLLPILTGLLLVPLLVVNPRRFTRQTRLSRTFSLAVVLVIAAANLVSLGMLLHALLNATANQGRSLLIAAAQIWLTNIIVFGLAFWEMDRGGPVARSQLSRAQLPPADFRFCQDEDAETVTEVAVRSSVRSNWIPTFVDYLYVSVTNSVAFSPTDTMPLSTRAKLLMAVQSVMALLTSVLVIARAVNILR